MGEGEWRPMSEVPKNRDVLALLDDGFGYWMEIVRFNLRHERLVPCSVFHGPSLFIKQQDEGQHWFVAWHELPAIANLPPPPETQEKTP